MTKNIVWFKCIKIKKITLSNFLDKSSLDKYLSNCKHVLKDVLSIICFFIAIQYNSLS